MIYASSVVLAAAKDVDTVSKVASPPMLYWVFWAILILTMALLVAYVIEMRRVEGHGHGNEEHGNEGHGHGNKGHGNEEHGNEGHGHGNKGHGNEGHGHGNKGHGKSIYDGLTFAGIVSALALGAFAITFSSEFYKYAKYYEHPVIGVIRFIVMAITALLLIYYAIKGRHDH